MAKKQVLGFKPPPRLEQVDDEYSERVQDRKHRFQWCDDSALQCESKPDIIFGKDTAIANAIERAIGRRLTELPMSPPKVLAAIDAREQAYAIIYYWSD
jgi:hypothetical protein